MKRFMYLLLIMLIFTLTSCKKNKEYEIKIIDEVVQTGEYLLDAKITQPITNEEHSIVVFIHGSGANDMDESVGALKMFENLANELAKKGIASIRYNKRTYQYSNELANKTDFTIYEEVIDDALSAVELCKNKYNYEKIYLIGHSFGGQLAPVIANKSDCIDGVIIMSGTLEHIIDLAMKQLKDQDSPYYDVYDPYDEYFRGIKEIVEGEENYFFMGAYEEYWVSYNNINIKAETIKCAQNKKFMITQGEKDLQVEYAEIENYKELLNDYDVLYKLYENLNHMYVDGTNDTITTAYQVAQEIPFFVIDDLYQFINGE